MDTQQINNALDRIFNEEGQRDNRTIRRNTMTRVAIKFLWADKDAEAVREMEGRLASAARQDRLLSYSDLACGIKFTLATGERTKVVEIDTSNWSEHERAIIGDYLGFISYRTYTEAGFLASALAVTKEEGAPSEPFFKYALELGALRPQQSRLEFWSQQVAKAQAWYRNNRDR